MGLESTCPTNTMNQFMFISGLPRTGSTLLSSILSQNPKLYSEGNSGVCQLMWDMQQSCLLNIDEQLESSGRDFTPIDLISSIPNIYYKGLDKKIIFDKCRAWTFPLNTQLIKKYITSTPKIIVLERPIQEIVASFVALRRANNYVGNPEDGLLDNLSEPIVRSLIGVNLAKQNNNGEYLFVSYDDLILNTKNTIKKIYSFCELKPFKHDFDNIINKHKEHNATYNLFGLHDIRPKIEKRSLDVVLSPDTISRCLELQL
jgi:sulfotransferase